MVNGPPHRLRHHLHDFLHVVAGARPVAHALEHRRVLDALVEGGALDRLFVGRNFVHFHENGVRKKAGRFLDVEREGANAFHPRAPPVEQLLFYHEAKLAPNGNRLEQGQESAWLGARAQLVFNVNRVCFLIKKH